MVFRIRRPRWDHTTSVRSKLDYLAWEGLEMLLLRFCLVWSITRIPVLALD